MVFSWTVTYYGILCEGEGEREGEREGGRGSKARVEGGREKERVKRGREKERGGVPLKNSILS